MDQLIEAFIEDYITALRNGNAAVFAGADLSKATGSLRIS